MNKYQREYKEDGYEVLYSLVNLNYEIWYTAPHSTTAELMADGFTTMDGAIKYLRSE